MSRSQWFTAVTVIACSGATLFLRGQPRIVSAAKQRMAEIMPLGTAFRQQLSNTQQMLIFLTQKLARSPASKTSIALSDSLSQSEVTLGGVGPLRLGMTLEEATQVTSNLLIPSISAIATCQYFRLRQASADLGLMVVEDTLTRIDVWAGAQLQTPSGAHLGSTKAEIEEIYPEQIEARDRTLSGSQYLTLIPHGANERLFRLVFETDAAGKVVQLITGQFPAVTWPGNCS